MKPLITWGSNKSYDVNMVMPFIPVNYTMYIQPFAGSASLFFNLEPTCPALLNDINDDLINFYQQIKSGNSNAIKNFMDYTPNNKTTYYDILHNFYPTTPTEQASQFYYLRKTCHRSSLRFNKYGLFNVAYGNNTNIDYSILSDIRYFNLLQNTTITNNDFLQIFNSHNDPNYFIFIDAPDDNRANISQFLPDDHLRLFRSFTQSHSKCLMIIKDTIFTKELYKDYIIAAYPTFGRYGTKLICANV
jgi:DNA adenine methylase